MMQFCMLKRPACVQFWDAKGWLVTISETGVLDFSGSAVVHITGGMIGLAVRACKNM